MNYDFSFFVDQWHIYWGLGIALSIALFILVTILAVDSLKDMKDMFKIPKKDIMWHSPYIVAAIGVLALPLINYIIVCCLLALTIIALVVLPFRIIYLIKDRDEL